jgi:RNA polymerase sigma factor (sigma-70 family)
MGIIVKGTLNDLIKKYERERQSISSESLRKNHEKELENEELYGALSKLDSRKREIIMRNFGLGEYEPQTYEEISKIFSISKARVGQLKERALKDLGIIMGKNIIKREGKYQRNV